MELLVSVAQELSLARSLEAVQRIVRTAARKLLGADGATFVLRDDDQCFYADEDAIAPLWKGKRFPLTACISGWVMLNRRPVVIEDIYADERIPAEAYRPTFVKSLAMVPIRTASPIGAIGNYWARHRKPNESELKLLQALADSTSIALENVKLYEELEGRIRDSGRALASAQRSEAEARHEIAERIRAERALVDSQEQLRQAQKMEAIGLLAAGVAHDFNNVLTVILSYAAMVARALEPGSALRQDVDEIVGAGERAAALTQQLLAFSRQQLREPRSLRLDQVLVGIDKMLRRLAGETIQLQIEHDSDLLPTFADPVQVEQVLLNLVVNARDAMPSGGTLKVEARNTELAEGELYGIGAGEYVTLRVSDTGTGMAEEVRSRIFEPFFTTKDKGKGTGLGLSTVYGIVKQSQGHIAVTSRLGEGTCFTIHLPSHEAPYGFRDQPVPEPELCGSETVLLVEGDDHVRSVARNILTRNGYRVLEAANARAALEIYGARSTEIDLVLSDGIMAEQSGESFAQQLKAAYPGVKLLCMSGHPEAVPEDLPFLQKPLTPKGLLSKVREMF